MSPRRYALGLADRVLENLRKLDHSLGGLSGEPPRPLAAGGDTRAAGQADEELVVAALLHDIGDELGALQPCEVAAGILRPYVREEVTWIVAHHGLFQNYYYVHHFGGDRNARERLRGHPAYDACVHFCAAWDQSSFDPDYASEPLAAFEPMVRRIFARAPHDSRYTAAPLG